MAVTAQTNKPRDFEAIKARVKRHLDTLHCSSWKVDYETDDKSIRVTIEPTQPHLIDITETFALAAALHEANMKVITHKGVRVVAHIDKGKPIRYGGGKGGLKNEIRSRTKNALDVLVSVVVILGRQKDKDEGKVAGKGVWSEVWKEWNESLQEFFQAVEVARDGDNGYWYVKK